MRELETMLNNEQITYSRMVEILNEKAFEPELRWAYGTVKCDLCEHKWVAVRKEGSSVLECPNCNHLGPFTATKE